VENQQLTGADRTPEQIQAEMTQTRESLTGKVAALENQVVGTVQTAADTLTGTVESVKSLITTAPSAVGDTVKQAAQAVGESVKKTFDISGHVRECPLTAVGISILAGGLTGYLLGRGKTMGLSGAVAPQWPVAGPAPAPTPPRSEPGVLDEFVTMIGRKFREAAENIIDTTSEAVNRNVREGVPKLVDAAGELAAERLTPGESRTPRYAGFTG
jgi:ElaB/YqjD/DUF883 family membrane-anchored ribosome-binding protein